MSVGLLAFARPAAADLWSPVASAVAPARKTPSTAGMIKHLIFIIQENRSFDHYFGTFPGADGIPYPPPCLPDQWHPSQCDMPYESHIDSNQGNAHGNKWQVISIDGGKMDGFVNAREQFLGSKCQDARNKGRTLPNSWYDNEGVIAQKQCIVDVMGYHDGTDLPNYWAYASHYVLEDHFFENTESWSQPNHLGIFSGWSAKCTQTNPPDINSCASSFGGIPWSDHAPMPDLWTDITYLLFQNNITWSVYLDGGQGSPFGQKQVPGIWNVLPGFQTVQEDGQVGNALLTQQQFYVDAALGRLPQVTWLLPHYYDSEHPQASILHGQTYVTGLINAIMHSPDWSSSAIFVMWDDADGFYDHEPPPFQFDTLGLGIRLPAFMISPYAIPGLIDHQVCSSDCYLKLIEDTFLDGERMSESGRPDPRPDYRDAQPAYGDLRNDFNFEQKPLPPLVLSTHPMSLLR